MIDRRPTALRAADEGDRRSVSTKSQMKCVGFETPARTTPPRAAAGVSHRPPVAPGAREDGGGVWDALTTSFADMDSRGGVDGPEGAALEETLESLRGLLQMHLQRRRKAVALTAKKVEVTRERDAALERLAALGDDPALAHERFGR